MSDKTEEEVNKDNKKLEDALSAFGSLDDSKIEGLKKKMEAKKMNKLDQSIKIAVIGVGQGGSRLAETFHKKGYSSCVINTSKQDLEFISVDEDRKLLLEGSLGGTGKDLDLGREIFEDSVGQIEEFIHPTLDGHDMAYLTVSGGGGTGSSSVDTMIDILFSMGLPIGVIYILPKQTDDAKSKSNSIETLSRLASMATENKISNLIVVDNAKIEQIFAGLSQSKFWETSNDAIVDPLVKFNSLTSKASRHTSLDPSDFAKIISCGDCSIYGVIETTNIEEETGLAEAVIESLQENMLAEGFDVSQTRVGGVIICADSQTLDSMPAININYCFHMISEQTKGASIFQGVYDDESCDGKVKIYTWFAGLGLPMKRIDTLKNESKALEEMQREKESGRSDQMSIDLGTDKTTKMTDQINRKIKKKTSSFGKLQRGGRTSSIIDRRRKR